MRKRIFAPSAKVLLTEKESIQNVIIVTRRLQNNSLEDASEYVHTLVNQSIHLLPQRQGG